MKKLAIVTSVAGGILLLLVPRYILPACEYEGYARMHCSDTASAEYLIGGLLLLVGAGTLILKRTWQLIAGSAVSLVLFGAAYWMPAKFGYCQSPRMPCNYGMVPGVRFIAIGGMVLMIIALAGFVKASRRKGIS